MMPMVRYWRARKASAPSRMAFEMACMSSVPMSPARTERAMRRAARSARTPTARAIQSQTVSLLEIAGGGWGIVLKGEKQSRRCAEMHEQVSS